jgi:hypothetical protein
MWAAAELDLSRLLTERTFQAYPFGPVAAVYLAAVFAARVFRPEAVRRRWLFRLSVGCFALALLLPCASDLEAILQAMSSHPLNEARLLQVRLEARPFIDLLAQVLLVLAVLTGLAALGRPADAGPKRD